MKRQSNDDWAVFGEHHNTDSHMSCLEHCPRLGRFCDQAIKHASVSGCHTQIMAPSQARLWYTLLSFVPWLFKPNSGLNRVVQ